MWFDEVIMDDLDEELESEISTFKHPNGYTNVTINNQKYPNR